MSTMLLHEAPSGYMLFKVLGDEDSTSVDDLWKATDSSDKSALHSALKFKSFKPFETTTDAVASATALIEGKIEKPLRKFLKKNLNLEKDTLGVSESKLAKSIKKKLGVNCEMNSFSAEMSRLIRCNLSELCPDLFPTASGDDKTAKSAAFNSMQLGLAHSLSRYKLKFSPDKVDTMVIHAISLLDELDKELNTYAMRAREWYGWHFPELAKLLPDNLSYAKLVLEAGLRPNVRSTDLSSIVPTTEDEELIKAAADISMGTEISDEDLTSIKSLCTQVVDLTAYRSNLFTYLKSRMNAIAPNLTTLVGEMVGARLISQSGSLLNLAKSPASTLQILGAEKALFRALKEKKDTPKYGLLFHASLVGQVGMKHKGKISRVLAAKAALATRVDALGEEEGVTIGLKCRETVEKRVRMLQERDGGVRMNGDGGKQKKYEKDDSATQVYDDSMDVKLEKPVGNGKRKIEEVESTSSDEGEPKKEKKKHKKEKKDKKKKKKKDK